MSWGEGSMNWAELRDLVDHLPEDSATKAASGGDVQGRRWNQSTYILAAQYNALLLMIRVLWAAHLKGDPPDMSSIDPPALEADEQRVEQEEAAVRRSEALLNRYSPGRADDQTAIDHWASKIRELETQ
ncbi:hypothetical protein K388_05585 [Streptomyces sp. KhCrAH-43]|uniref:hypothetical protein n=1 Tax=unclassified Streptomyces TaxID=2593676 RepID=UPI00037458CF|nr:MULTISPECIES: hypothetical protein [unclassified Streptomyces]MYX67356.1 hypothetical protein [Streptomyces sp. SID8373]RAJ53798.1 hypothetical protein K388_05585 [Streptomyces sp. KhCrAH-43]